MGRKLIRALLHFSDLRSDHSESEARDAETRPRIIGILPKSLRLNGGVSEVRRPGHAHSTRVMERAFRASRSRRRRLESLGRWTLGGSREPCPLSRALGRPGGFNLSLCSETEPDLQARSLRDSVGDLYETARLIRRSTYQREAHSRYSTALFEEGEARFGGRPDAIICDRWRVDELKDALDDPSAGSAVNLIVRGQGLQRWFRRCTGMATGVRRTQG